jgi:hypothetical protein
LLEQFDVAALVALVGDKHRRELEGWLQLLVDRGALERASDGDQAFRFRSPLFQETAYQMLPPGDRGLGRRLVRAYFEESGRTIPEHLVAGRTGTEFRARPASEAA